MILVFFVEVRQMFYNRVIVPEHCQRSTLSVNRKTISKQTKIDRLNLNYMQYLENTNLKFKTYKKPRI